MKKKLVDVLILGRAMERLEAGKLEFNAQGTIRYARARNAVRVHSEAFQEQVMAEFRKAPEKTHAEFQKAQDTVLEAINGEEVELQLPPPIPTEWIREIHTPSASEHEALAVLLDVVIGSPEAPATP